MMTQWTCTPTTSTTTTTPTTYTTSTTVTTLTTQTTHTTPSTATTPTTLTTPTTYTTQTTLTTPILHQLHRGGHPDPEKRGGAGLKKKKFSGSFWPQFGLQIREDPPLDPPLALDMRL